MQLLSEFNKRVRFLLCVKKNINAFQKVLDESNRKADKIWVDKEVNLK